jgi:hypothetical protein
MLYFTHFLVPCVFLLCLLLLCALQLIQKYIILFVILMEFHYIFVLQEVLAIQVGEVLEESEGHLVRIGTGIHPTRVNMLETHQDNSMGIMQ